MSEETELVPGTEIGGYRIVRKIGTGGMGIVYQATQLSMDRSVALKILYSHTTEQEHALVDFVNEARLLARLDHPNIVTAFDFGEQDGLHYLAMAYVEGEDLADRIHRQGTVPEEESLLIGKKVAEALRYAWEKHDMLHRDVNPANIMIDRFGDVRIMDLGISRSLAEEPGDEKEVLEGTPNYMSPEQAADKSLDFRSDLYSLGATLYVMLTGVVPFDEPDPVVVLQRKQQEDLPPVHKVNPEVSARASALVQVMMARSPEDRFSSWSDFIQKVDQLLEGDSPSTVSRPKTAPAGGGSTKKTVRTPQTSRPPRPVTQRPVAKKTAGGGVAIAVGVVASLSFIGYWFGVALPAREAEAVRQAEEQARADADAQRRAELTERLEQARSLLKQIPPDFQKSLAQLRKLERDAEGSGLEQDITDQIRLVREMMGRPKDPRIDPNPHTPEKPAFTAAERARQDEAFKQLKLDVVAALLRTDLAAARRLVESAELQSWYAELNDQLSTWETSLKGLEQVAKDIEGSLLADCGKVVTFRLKDGAERLYLRGVRDGQLDTLVLLYRDTEPYAQVPRPLSFSDLHSAELMERMNGQREESVLAQALMAARDGDRERAQTLLEESSLPLADTVREYLASNS